MAESMGVAKRRITRTRHISIATFFEDAQPPLWVGCFETMPSPFEDGVPGPGAPGFLDPCLLQ